MKADWPGRPTRADFLAPRGFRERLALRIGRSLVERYDFELGAETSRADYGWESYTRRTEQLRATGARVSGLDMRREAGREKEGA